ncbi:MAG: Ty1/Copia family ribonuclease HI, partial [Myxococcota bacterium]
WAITLGRFDIAFTVAMLAQYSAAPKNGHLAAGVQLMGYLAGTSKAKILYNAREPDYTGVKPSESFWGDLYPNTKEEIDESHPEPKGKPVVLLVFVDADHARDVATRQSVTGIMAFLNNTPVPWYSKRQATVESSTYGSELVAARIATEMIWDMRYSLRSIGVPLKGPTHLFGDNQLVVTSTTLPSSTLKKKHNAIAYHKIRETIAARIMMLHHIPGTINPADLLTKPLGPFIHKKLTHPLLHGNPSEVAGGGECQTGRHPTWIETTADVAGAIAAKETNKPIGVIRGYGDAKSWPGQAKPQKGSVNEKGGEKIGTQKKKRDESRRGATKGNQVPLHTPP